MKLDLYPTPLTKMNDLNVKPEAVKLLQENIGKNSLTLVFKWFHIWPLKTPSNWTL